MSERDVVQPILTLDEFELRFRLSVHGEAITCVRCGMTWLARDIDGDARLTALVDHLSVCMGSQVRIPRPTLTERQWLLLEELGGPR